MTGGYTDGNGMIGQQTVGQQTVGQQGVGQQGVGPGRPIRRGRKLQFAFTPT
ncbi:MAG: hypothetical protein ACT4OS_05685 [Acidimicrobiales bacterium]